MYRYGGIYIDADAIVLDTLEPYFQILEDTFLGHRIQPWRKVKKRRLIETEKFYLFDIGLTNYLARRTPKIGTPEFGHSFEHYILMELKAYQAYRNPELDIRYWRTSTGFEVDFILGDMNVAIEISYIHLTMLNHLRTVEQYRNSPGMCLTYHLFYRVYGSQGVGGMGECHNPGPVAKKLIQFFKIQFSFFIKWDDLQICSLALTHHLPGDNVGVVFHFRDQNLIPRSDILFTKGEGYRIDRSGGSAGEYNLTGGAGIQKGPDGLPGCFITSGHLLTQEMDTRDFGIGAQILHDLNITKMRLMTNSDQAKRVGIVGYGLEIVDYSPY